MNNIHVKNHRLTLPSTQAGVPTWPSYTGVSQLVGTSPSGRATIYVDPNLGPQGLQNATDLVNDADRVAGHNDTLFGARGGNVDVIIFALSGLTDGTGGADHMGCDFSTGQEIEVCAAFGSPMRVSALFEAELSECAMNRNLCGLSTGEALSRWCAAVVSNNALADFATGPAWAQAGMPDFVNTTDQTDRGAVSTGCGMIFLSWMQGPTTKNGAVTQYSLAKIAQAMVGLGDAGTFADLYNALTSDAAANAWPQFQAAVSALPGGVVDDDPFGGFVAM